MRKGMRLSSFCLLLLCVILLNACSEHADLEIAKEKNIALIAKMNYGYHWGTVKMGANAAAREFNVNVDFAAPNDEEDISEQVRLVNQALNNQVDALILAAGDYEALVEVTEKAYNRQIPVIIIDSEVDTEKIHGCIATDNLDAGKKAGNVLLGVAGMDCRIGIINSINGSRNAEQREKGLLDVISQYPQMKVVAKKYCFSDTKLAYQLTREMIANYPEINAIVALNSISSEGAAQAIDEMDLEDKVKLIAFGSTLQEIDFMDKGVIQATIIQNPFSMGYLGVKYAVEAIEGKKIPKRVDTGSWAVSRENMYTPENQKRLFPIIK